MARLLLALVLGSLMAPTGAASGRLHGPLATIEVEDRFGDSCSIPVAGFCLFLVDSPGEPGNMTVDARQRVDYVGVATDFSLLRDELGDAWLLPDKAVSQRISNLYVEHPAWRTTTETWEGQEHPGETDRLEMSKDNFTLYYPVPSYEEPGTFEPYSWGLLYRDWLGYDRLGPFHEQPLNSTDNYYWQIEAEVCWDGETRDCPPELAEAFDIGRRTSPNVDVGVEMYTLEVATDPSNLTPPSFGAYGAIQAASASSRGNLSPPAVARASPGSPLPRDEGTESAYPKDRRRLDPFVDAPQQAQIRVHALASPPPTDLPVKLILGATAAGLLLVALGAGLYSRFHSRSEVLKSSTRDRLVELIRQNPGISMTDAAQAMGLARNAVHHHVRMLARVQVVRVAGEGGRKTLYLVGAKPSDAPPAWLLKNAACAAIVRALQASPSGLPREAVHGLLPDVPERTRNYNIQKLLSVGVVVQVETPEGGKVLRAASSATGA